MDYLLTSDQKDKLTTYFTLCSTKFNNVKDNVSSFYEVNKETIDFWLISIGDTLSNIVSFVFLLCGGVLYSLSNILMSVWSYVMNVTNRKRIIMDRVNNEPYLERYYIFLKDRPEYFPFNIFIHKFLKSDPDELHDHPWGFFTVVLSGGYWEYTDVNTVKRNKDGLSITDTTTIKNWRGPGFFQKVEATHKHRIELKEDVTAWTLFIPFKRTREWGFYTENGWVNHKTYLKNSENNENSENKKND
tara:strand:+ start:3898 stop:4632 length:735 start_codon:yes stop_codon:yes gene_type:complete